MDSRTLKNEAMAWLRFKRRMPVVCTEAGIWSADVLGISKTESLEIEVKVSKSDLRAEFANKALKHSSYNLGHHHHVPNRLFFLVPMVMKEYALEVLQEKCSTAGVAVYTGIGRPGDRLEVVRKSKKLHDRAPSKDFFETCLLRMSSELVSISHMVSKYRDRGEQIIENTHQEVLELVASQFSAHEEQHGDY